jgi:uncharacterized protein YndB with AHSA1/START domain
MTVDHGDFTIDKVIAAQPANVFRAFAEQELKRTWFAEGRPKSKGDDRLDFRAGRAESGRFEIAEGPGAGLDENATTYIDIVDGERIVHAHTMAWNGRVHSASRTTVSVAPSEAGCKLTVTEQGAYFAPSDGPVLRRGGVEAQLDTLTRLFD